MSNRNRDRRDRKRSHERNSRDAERSVKRANVITDVDTDSSGNLHLSNSSSQGSFRNQSTSSRNERTYASHPEQNYDMIENFKTEQSDEEHNNAHPNFNLTTQNARSNHHQSTSSVSISRSSLGFWPRSPDDLYSQTVPGPSGPVSTNPSRERNQSGFVENTTHQNSNSTLPTDPRLSLVPRNHMRASPHQFPTPTMPTDPRLSLVTRNHMHASSHGNATSTVPTDPRLSVANRNQARASPHQSSSSRLPPPKKSSKPTGPPRATVIIAGKEVHFDNLKSLRMNIGSHGNDGTMSMAVSSVEPLQRLDESSTAWLFRNKTPIECYLLVCERNSLHQVLKDAWDDIGNGCFPGKEERFKLMERFFRFVFEYLPVAIMWKQDSFGNTLLHRAIQCKAKNIVLFLLDKGSPLYIRNNIGMTAVETCIIMEEFELLDMVLKKGGRFNHIISTDPFARCDQHEMQSWLLKLPKAVDKAKEISDLLEVACWDARQQLCDKAIDQCDCTPIVSFQRGDNFEHPFETTIELVVPRDWSESPESEYMLIVIPMVFNQKKRRFKGASQTPCQMVPLVCGEPCAPMINEKPGSILYYATDALKKHFNKFTESRPDEHIQVCSINLHIAPRAVFEFMACQIIQFIPLNKNIIPTKKKFNESRQTDLGPGCYYFH